MNGYPQRPNFPQRPQRPQRTQRPQMNGPQMGGRPQAEQMSFFEALRRSGLDNGDRLSKLQWAQIMARAERQGLVELLPGPGFQYLIGPEFWAALRQSFPQANDNIGDDDGDDYGEDGFDDEQRIYQQDNQGFQRPRPRPRPRPY